MKLRLAPMAWARHAHGQWQTSGGWRRRESLLRTGQLILAVWLAVLGAHQVAKGIVHAAALIAGLLR